MKKTVHRTILIIAIAGTLVAALTGYIGVWLDGRSHGWLLIVHLAAAPVVILAFALVAVVWGRSHRFDEPDQAIGPVRKLAFWLLRVCALVNMTTMLAAMLPAFGYVGQHRLSIGHDWSGYGLLASGALYLMVACVARNPRKVARNAK